MRCPAPGRGKPTCGKALGWVASGKRGHVCVGAEGQLDGDELRSCPGCGTMLSFRFEVASAKAS